MSQELNQTPQKSKKSISTIVFFVSAAIVAILAITYLISNVMLFQKVVNQYVEQGYQKAEVVSQLVQSLISEIVQPIAIMGGIAVLLFAAGIINDKISRCLSLLDKDDAVENAGENTTGDNVVEMESSEENEGDGQSIN
jgi:hypothetical protein